MKKEIRERLRERGEDNGRGVKRKEMQSRMERGQRGELRGRRRE